MHDNEETKEQKLLSTINLRFNDVASIENGFFIGLNKNYLIFITKSLKLNSIKKILIDDKHVMVTSLKVFNSENSIGVGLSDGSIKIFSCNIDTKQHLDEDYNDNIKVEPSASTSNYQSNITTKSCAIQNIIEGERKLYDTHQALLHLDNQEIKPPSFDDSVKQLRMKVNNDQILLSNFSLKSQTVKKILLTKDEQILFAIVGDRLMIFDMFKNDEVDAFPVGKEEDVKDIGLIESDSKRKYFITCNFKNECQIHEINEELFI